MSNRKEPSTGTLTESPRPSSQSTLNEPGTSRFDAENHGAILPQTLPPVRNLWSRLKAEVDTSSVSTPLAAYCFMTGFLCVEPFFSSCAPIPQKMIQKKQGCHLVCSHLRMVRIPNRKLRPSTYFIEGLVSRFFFFSLNVYHVSRFTVVHLRLSYLRRRAGTW